VNRANGGIEIYGLKNQPPFESGGIAAAATGGAPDYRIRAPLDGWRIDTAFRCFKADPHSARVL